MYRFMNVSGQGQAERSKNYDGFPGKVIVVDLATVNGETEEFEGRDWLDGITRENKPVGWDLEWQPDRTKETDNPIALMQFADESIALLLRTHKTRNWLPMSVMRALMSENCKKVQVGWDGPDRQKMQNTFNFHPLGIVDMSELAKVKGVAAQGLKSLSEHFGMKMQKDPKIARSNWAGMQLTKEQEQYAAEDAYFSFMLYQKLTRLPDAPLDRDHDQFNEVVNKGVLELRPGWEEQGIARRHDGLWCTMCNQGPMTVPEIVAKHMEGAKHKKRWEQREGLGAFADGHFPDLPDKYTSQHIVQGDDSNGLKPGEFKCILCNAGPFNALATVDAHLKSKKHTGRMAPAEPQEQTDLPAEYTSQHIVQGDGCNGLKPGEFKCTLCNAGPFNALVTADAHIKSKKHTQRMTPAKPQEQTDLPDEYTSQCIIQGDGCNDLKPGEFRCTLCNAGPFNALVTVDAHLKSKKHTQRMATADPQNQTDESAKKDLLEGKEWNLPDYVTIVSGALECTLCPAKANAYKTMAMHLGGDRHAKKCRGSGDPEIMWVPERQQLEVIETGKPVVRRGFEKPWEGEAEAARQGEGAAGTGPLPEGWQEFTDPASGHLYYYHAAQGVSQWERPAAAAQDSQLQPQQAQATEQGEASAIAQEAAQGAAAGEPGPEAAAEPGPEALLPPGWYAVWSEESGAHYYADAETQVSQWDRPPPYVALDWARRSDPEGRAFWACREFSFYETDAAWQRFSDSENRIYWSSATLQQRFFEPVVASS